MDRPRESSNNVDATARHETFRKYFRSRNVGHRGQLELEETRTAQNPDAFAREVTAAVAAGFERLSTIAGVSTYVGDLARGLPAPAARLLVGIVGLLEEFEDACHERRRALGEVNRGGD